MSIVVGDVVAVVGIEITLRARESANLETHFYNGETFRGISIREFISITHGFRDIVCLVEGEFLDERHTEGEGPSEHYIRKVKVRPVGYFEDEVFFDGIKFLPKIGDSASLLPQSRVEKIFEGRGDMSFSIGRLLKEDLPVSLPWDKLFNTHIGIFGNTGSGKSNTLARRLYI